MVATGIEPWLDVSGIDISLFAGRLIELVYRSSLLDEPARPVFRFMTRDGFVDHIGAAPTAGAAVWIGRVPKNTISLSVSPTNRLGPFVFRIEHVRARAWPDLIIESVRRRPRQTCSAVLTRCIGWGPESDNNLAWATSATDFESYAGWFARRARQLDVGDVDRPRFDWNTADRVTVVIRSDGDRQALSSTLASLKSQAYRTWDALIVGETSDRPSGDRHLVSTDLDGAVRRLGGEAGEVVFGPLQAGDILPPYALAFLAEQRRRSPAVRMFYGDEVAAGRPVLKPGWAPRLMATRPFVGNALCVSGLNDWSSEERRVFVAEGTLPMSLATAPDDLVKPLRRVLLDTPRAFSAPSVTTCASRSIDISPPTSIEPAAVVILTCDQPALLSRAVASVRAKSPPGSYRMFVVDNGRADGPAADLLSDLENEPDVVLLRRPGRFTYSGHCNDAVAASTENLLVFLNDDTEVLSEGWLERLSASAFDDGIGAVGAKLTFPDGRLQHVGVLVGMGGSAGHLGAMAPGDDAGWVGRNDVAHEVSAVTGACLAVARDKFLAVGGFDAEHLPVELSDVDLCLKLNARGWQTIIDPQVRLLHEESASRGRATFRRLDVYGGQRGIFIDRWRHVLRDDPTFHPGLSLFSLKPALG